MTITPWTPNASEPPTAAIAPPAISTAAAMTKAPRRSEDVSCAIILSLPAHMAVHSRGLSRTAAAVKQCGKRALQCTAEGTDAVRAPRWWDANRCEANGMCIVREVATLSESNESDYDLHPGGAQFAMESVRHSYAPVK